MPRELMAALLVLLAGCSGLTGGTPSPQPTEPQPAQTTTASPTDDAPADATPDNTVNYTALSAAEKRAFDAARRGGIAFAPEYIRESPYVNRTYYPSETKDALRTHRYVRKDGSYVRLSWSRGRLIATYSVRATERRPPENAAVVAVGDLSPRAREAVRKAIENGSYDTPPGKWQSLPAGLEGVEYVRDGETPYKLSIAVGDFWPDRMRAEPVEDSGVS